MITAFGSIGGNVAMFQPRQRPKRIAPQQQHDVDREKRTRTDNTPIIPAANAPNILANYDITQIPLASLVSLCMTVLQTVPLAVMEQRVPLLPAEGVTLAVTRPGFVRSTTPPYPPPPEQPQYNTNPRFKYENEVKLEPQDSDDEEMEIPPMAAKRFKKEIVEEPKEEKPPVQVLASVEERASQALKMQPYELATEVALTNDEKRTLLKMSMQRILDAEKVFQPHHLLANENSRKAIADGPTTAVAPAATATPTGPPKNVWLLLVAKLITRGINHKNPIVKQETENEDVVMDAENEEDNKKLIIAANDTTDTSIELKETLIDFIVDNLAIR
jgi:symplekin